jgi:hypothetical protein
MNQVSQAPATGMTPDPDPQTLETTRAKVRQLLDQSEAFKKLPPEERREIARNMVRVGSYMANPDGLLREASEEARGSPLAAQQASSRVSSGGVRAASRRASGDHGFAGEDFEGGAIRQGTEQFGELVSKVDFPAFVGGLIENVFQAIVTSSIDQMRAYAEMLKSVSQSVDDFARDNITENNARDWLSDTYPDLFDVSTSGGDDMGFGFGEEGGTPQPRLVTKGEEVETGLKTVSQDLGLEKPITDISDAETEAALVRSARMAMAKSRMQLLASMVVLGINRIVVTDGSIRAKVIFGMRASDIARRRSKASLYDRQASSRRSVAAIGFGFLGFGGGAATSSTQSHVTTVGSSLDESSSSQAQLKAQLSGEVRVNFKSDYLPAEKLATPEMMAAIQGNAVPQQPPHLQQAASGGGTAPAAATPGANTATGGT